MAGLDGASRTPDGLAPVPVPSRGPSGRATLGVVAAALIAVVGIALVGQTGDEEPGSQAALGAPTAVPTGAPTARPTARSAARPVATPSPTAPPTPIPGTPPPRMAVSAGPAPTCPPGSTPDEPGPVDQARPREPDMAFDRRAGRLVALAGTDDGVETWTFDVCTNTWAADIGAKHAIARRVQTERPAQILRASRRGAMQGAPPAATTTSNACTVSATADVI